MQTAQYHTMSKDEIDKLIQTKILVNFKTWVQEMFEDSLFQLPSAKDVKEGQLGRRPS